MKFHDVSIAGVIGTDREIRDLFAGLPGQFPVPVLCMPAADEGIRLMRDLSFITHLDTCWAQHGMRPRRGVVHVAPPSAATVLMPDGRLGVSPVAAPAASPEALLLGSLAQSHHGTALVLVLGTANASIANGLASVKAAGGIVIADEAALANGVRAGHSDYVLSAREAAALLSEMAARVPFGISPELASDLSDLLAEARALWDTPLGNIQLLDPLSSTLLITVLHGHNEGFRQRFGEIDVTRHTTCGRAAIEGRRIMVEDVAADPLFEPYRADAEAAGFCAVQSTPIFVGNRLRGVLNTHSAQRRGLAPTEAARLDHLANEAGRQIEVRS